MRVLFLCTQNSARSQMAEALVHERGDARIEAGSAGTAPGARVNPYAVAELKRRGIEWSEARPKSIDDVAGESWDVAITVCDNARESCPYFPSPVRAHWGVFDPAAIEGDDAAKRRAFEEAARILERCIVRLLSLRLEQLDTAALQHELDAIGKEELDASEKDEPRTRVDVTNGRAPPDIS